MSSTENEREFNVIRSHFLCAVPVKKINWQNVLNKLTWNDQKTLLQQTLHWPPLKRYPLQVNYVIRFLRHIIDTLESRNEEIHDDLYEIFCDYQVKATQLDNGVFSYKHYCVNVDGQSEIITLKENHNKISQGTTGLNVWEAALALCEWSVANKLLICGKNVLELGAGIGLSGLVIGKCCRPTSITLTDGDDNVLDYLTENVRNNFHRDEDGNYSKGCTSIGMSYAPESWATFHVQKLDWFDASLAKNVQCKERIPLPDLIIAADVIYDNSLFRPLCETIDRIFTKCQNQCKLLLVNAVRNEMTQIEFFKLLTTFAFDVHEEQLVPPLHFYWEPNKFCPIKLYTISRSSHQMCE